MSYRAKCYKLYRKLQSIIAPRLLYSQTIYEDIIRKSIDNNSKWLDLGCGHNLLPPWRKEQECSLISCVEEVVGLDYDYGSLIKHKTINKKIRGNISYLPFKDNYFDIVTSNMVFEHLKEPVVQLEEIFRILKPGGTLLFHTPNSLSYTTFLAKLIPESIKDKIIYLLQNRKEEDVFPAFYKINSISNIKNHAQESGFEVDKIKLITSSAQFVMIPPLVFFELILIRFLMTKRMEEFRTNIIAKLTKPIKESVY